MKTCKKCEYYVEDITIREFAHNCGLDGYCEYLECGMCGDERPCKRFVEKEND